MYSETHIGLFFKKGSFPFHLKEKYFPQSQGSLMKKRKRDDTSFELVFIWVPHKPPAGLAEKQGVEPALAHNDRMVTLA